VRWDASSGPDERRRRHRTTIDAERLRLQRENRRLRASLEQIADCTETRCWLCAACINALLVLTDHDGERATK
jgi:hypothetical protein